MRIGKRSREENKKGEKKIKTCNMKRKKKFLWKKKRIWIGKKDRMKKNKIGKKDRVGKDNCKTKGLVD